MTTKVIAFVWWGSGGHVQPIASLLDYAKQYTNISSQSKRYRFGQRWWLEETYAEWYCEVTFVGVYTWKLRRYITFQSVCQNLRDSFLILCGFIQSLWYLRKYSVDVIFCKWWFVCPQVAYAWRLLNIPLQLHESDTHIWLANRLTMPIANVVYTGFWWLVANENVVWQILSPRLLLSKPMQIQWMSSQKTTVLVMWWSQGARVLYDTIYEILENKPFSWMQFIFLLWSKSAELKDKYNKQWQIWTFGYVSQEQIAALYVLSDLSITRGSASSLQEQQLFGIRKAIVPLPYTWGDHQTVNAKWYVDKYNDSRIPQDGLLRKSLETYLTTYYGYKKEANSPKIEVLCSASEIIRKWLII